MTIPNSDIELILFSASIDTTSRLKEFYPTWIANEVGKFQEINWLNTPGPIYTTYTDNCGTGQVEALRNVGGDEDYHEIIFKQPFSQLELVETLTAAAVDPFCAYFFDGNRHWNDGKVVEWWAKSTERLHYIVEMYENELSLPNLPHMPSLRMRYERFAGHLFGPTRPIPENYKYWLDFYQFGMKDYLEWYIFKMQGKAITLQALDYDWAKRVELDELYFSRTQES